MNLEEVKENLQQVLGDNFRVISVTLEEGSDTILNVTICPTIRSVSVTFTVGE